MGRIRQRMDVLKTLCVKFANEKGVDEGGLTAELFTLYYEKLDGFKVDGILLFRPPDADSIVLVPNESFADKKTKELGDSVRSMYRGFGIMLLRTMTAFLTTTQRLVPPRFAPGFVVDFLLERGPLKTHPQSRTPIANVLEDLKAAFGPTLFLLSAWNDPTFSFAGISYGLLTEKDGDYSRPVTRENLGDFTRLFAETKLITPIKPHLRAIKEGFTLLDMTEHLRLFQRHELLDYISGRYDFTAVELWACFSHEEEDGVDASWSDEPFKSTWRYLRKAVLKLMSNSERREFLRWCTGFSGLPSTRGKEGAALAITVIPLLPSEGMDRPYPLAHTCVPSVELPAFGSANELMERLFEGIRSCGGSFHIH